MKTTRSIISNVFICSYELQGEGDTVSLLLNTFDHTFLLASGSVKLYRKQPNTLEYIQESEEVINAPAMIHVPKETIYDIESVTKDSLGYSIYAIRDGYRVEDIVDDTKKLRLKDIVLAGLAAKDNADFLGLDKSIVGIWRNQVPITAEVELTPSRPWTEI